MVVEPVYCAVCERFEVGGALLEYDSRNYDTSKEGREASYLAGSVGVDQTFVRISDLKCVLMTMPRYWKFVHCVI